jgi:hypothetical protein
VLASAYQNPTTNYQNELEKPHPTVNGREKIPKFPQNSGEIAIGDYQKV